MLRKIFDVLKINSAEKMRIPSCLLVNGQAKRTSVTQARHTVNKDIIVLVFYKAQITSMQKLPKVLYDRRKKDSDLFRQSPFITYCSTLPQATYNDFICCKTFLCVMYCKSVAKTNRRFRLYPQTRINTGFLSTSQPKVITPTRQVVALT